ncbi:MAG: phytanoyl-CoA dioxygenase family protein [Acidimicrobiia bacterium]|nr:phytanoyl-CoA dioxygenase family protein [Acidimicrobiia bacterium]
MAADDVRFGPDATADELLVAIDAEGYAVVERLLDAERVSAIRAALAPVLAATPDGRNDFEGFATKRIYALFAKTRAFDDLAIHPLVLGVCDAILVHHQLSAPTGIEIGPGSPEQPLHRDDSIYPLPDPHREFVVNTMWALQDFTEENGATRLIPGSHGGQPRPDAPTIAAEMPAGSVLFYPGSLWHGGGANRSAEPRLGVILEYAWAYLRPQENHLLAVPREVAADLPERLQELLGYGICPPFVGYVDGRHPRRVLEG